MDASGLQRGTLSGRKRTNEHKADIRHHRTTSSFVTYRELSAVTGLEENGCPVEWTGSRQAEGRGGGCN